MKKYLLPNVTMVLSSAHSDTKEITTDEVECSSLERIKYLKIFQSYFYLKANRPLVG